MQRKEKIIILFVIFIFTLLFSSGSVLAEEESKTLEIVYPEIPGVATPKLVSIGLPNYIEYIFNFSFYLVALAILGALVYAGIQYFTSFGNPSKLTSARQGITAGFLGVLILLSSYLVFNTINPQLVIMEAPPPDIIEPVIKPGVYLCNYQPSVEAFIRSYRTGNKEEKIKAAIELNKIMGEEGSQNACFRVGASGNLRNFSFNPNKNTGFAIPGKKYVYNSESHETEISWEYNYGIIFHEKDNYRGEAQVEFFSEGKTGITELKFGRANSVTLFLKNDVSSTTITLYQCLSYNENVGMCPKRVIGQPNHVSFTVKSNEPVRVSKEELGKLARTGDNKDGARSITISPEGSGFALLYSEDNQKGKICNTFSENKGNLLEYEIGKCNAGIWFPQQSCVWISDTEEQLEDCVPCLKSMMIIKGQLIK
jgi:hypothetical protein